MKQRQVSTVEFSLVPLRFALAIKSRLSPVPLLLALDTESEQLVQAALDNLLSQKREITTIVIAHRLGTIRNANVIAVIDDGTVVELGSHDELMMSDKGYYKEMVQKSHGNKLATE